MLTQSEYVLISNFRFSHLRTCNREESSEYNLKLQNYRKSIVEQLVAIASKFINSLNESLYCFPSSVCWLVRQIHTLLTAGSTLTEKQVLYILHFVFYYLTWMYEKCIYILF